MGRCTAQCVKTIMNESCSFELARLKRKKKEKHFGCLHGDFLVQYFRNTLHATRSVVGHEVHENEKYIVIKAYKFTRDLFFHILHVHAIPTYRVY